MSPITERTMSLNFGRNPGKHDHPRQVENLSHPQKTQLAQVCSVLPYMITVHDRVTIRVPATESDIDTDMYTVQAHVSVCPYVRRIPPLI